MRKDDPVTDKEEVAAPEQELPQDGEDAVVPEVVLEPEEPPEEGIEGGDTLTTEEPAKESGREAGLVRFDPLQLYLAEVRQYSLLKREEEYDLAVRYKDTEDPDIAFQMVTANLRLVVKIAMEFRRSFINILDLIQEGNIGLMRAVKEYDPYRGTRFSYYASWWIRAYIIRYLLNNWRLVKIGTTQAQRKLFFNLKKERARLEALGFDPSPRLLASTLDVKEEEVVEMTQRLDGGEVSLDLPAYTDSHTTISDQISGDEGTQEDLFANAEIRALFLEKVSELSEDLKDRERRVLEARWLTEEPLTLQQLGDEMGVTRERVRQIEQRLMKKLRQRLKPALDVD